MMRTEAAVKMKEHAFNGKASISAIKFSNELKRACDSSRIYEGATVRLLREFMNGLAFLL